MKEDVSIREVTICIGSNVRTSREEVKAAIEFLQTTCIENAVVSDVYMTPPVGEGHGWYANAVISGGSRLTSGELNEVLKDYELSCGRDQQARKRGIVPIDIDIVIFDGKILREWDFSQHFFQCGYRMLISTGGCDKLREEVRSMAFDEPAAY